MEGLLAPGQRVEREWANMCPRGPTRNPQRSGCCPLGWGHILTGTATGLSDVVKVATLSLEGFAGHWGAQAIPRLVPSSRPPLSHPNRPNGLVSGQETAPLPIPRAYSLPPGVLEGKAASFIS